MCSAEGRWPRKCDAGHIMRALNRHSRQIYPIRTQSSEAVYVRGRAAIRRMHSGLGQRLGCSENWRGSEHCLIASFCSINVRAEAGFRQNLLDRSLVIEQVGFLVPRPLAVYLFFDMGIRTHVDDLVDACGRP